MSTEDQAYERLKEECKRRGYDFAIMCRLALRLSELAGTTIPRKIGKSPRRRKKRLLPKHKRLGVICVETGERFPTIRAAARAVGVVSSTISKALNGDNSTAAGYHWRWVEQKKQID